MTTFQEFHGYRGFAVSGEGKRYIVVLGFVTLGVAPFSITKKLGEIAESLKGVLK